MLSGRSCASSGANRTSLTNVEKFPAQVYNQARSAAVARTGRWYIYPRHRSVHKPAHERRLLCNWLHLQLSSRFIFLFPSATAIMAASLSKDQCQFFVDHGYLILRDVLSASEKEDLQRWAQEVHDWDTDASSPWMPYEASTPKPLQWYWSLPIQRINAALCRRSMPAASGCCAEQKIMQTTTRGSTIFSEDPDSWGS